MERGNNEVIGDIKRGALKNVYLLFGEEPYLARRYEAKLRAAVLDPAFEAMNMDVFEGGAVNLDDVENALNTLPFMCEKRLLVLRATGLFAAGKKAESERCAALVAGAPDTALLLFSESDVDKRLRLYKEVAKAGRAVECKTPGEKELADWVVRRMAKRGKRISTTDAVFLLRTVDSGMDAIEGEINKLADYLGKAEAASRADIERVCTKSLSARIFELVDAIGDKRAETALDIFNNMLVRKESPMMVISMIARQFRLILHSRLLADRGLPTAEIAERMGVRGFVASGCLKSGRHFSTDSLTQALRDCLETDLSIKTGKMNDKMAVEMLILKYSR